MNVEITINGKDIDEVLNKVSDTVMGIKELTFCISNIQYEKDYTDDLERKEYYESQIRMCCDDIKTLADNLYKELSH